MEATLESVWEAFRETQRRQQETDRLIKESKVENDRLIKELKESQAETDRQLKETDRKIDKLTDDVRSVNIMIGGMGNSNGDFAEEYFYNSIETNKDIFGEHFDECISSSKRYDKSSGKKIERDILLVNGKSVAIVEVKYKARREDIEKLIKKLTDFRALYTQYRSHGIYLGLAAMSFDKTVEEKCLENGIAVIKQVGDTVVINDEHLKVF